MRQSLSDITNSQEELDLQETGLGLSEQVNRLMKEINLARNKVKALHHELTCKNALLKAKRCEQEKEENTQPRNALTAENVLKIADEELERPFVPNRRRFIRSKSLGASTAHKVEAEKEKSETKRRQYRKKSARVRSAAQEVTENLFEIEDLQLTMPNEMCQQDNSTMASQTRKKEEEDEEKIRRNNLLTGHQDYKVRQSPVNRTLRRSAETIHSSSRRFHSVLR
ncbi:unnamed protein product [Microthlaspi erraticum]|uniref:Shugoshin C-terminal domain-containing protein n=1 Tax=Microthlaspi erraticum TaxID=1685480 RepID=A0A6D2II56_9BRAS|nr:unnamed protein product [Microthlaspi erraticum]